MPELPEVECVRGGLERAALHAPLASLWRSRKLLRTGSTWRRENLRVLDGTRPGPVARRGKFLLWHFEKPGAPTHALIVHLGMTGRLVLEAEHASRVPHTHLVLSFEDGRAVHFVDARRFGGLRAGVLEELQATTPLVELGLEPLSSAFSPDALTAAAGESKRTIRDVLLDQRVVAGIGNIYVSEILFAAGVHPFSKSHRLRPSAWERIARSTIDVLASSVRNGGTSLRDYRNADGDPGRNQIALQVYGRPGAPCFACGTPLVGYVHGGRSGVFCPRDQPRAVGGWAR